MDWVNEQGLGGVIGFAFLLRWGNCEYILTGGLRMIGWKGLGVAVLSVRLCTGIGLR